jgi:hypothetical protein
MFMGTLVAILGVVGSLPSAEAAVKIGDDKTFLNISPYFHMWYEHRGAGAPNGEDGLEDFRIRRARLWMDGQIGSPFITFEFQLAHDGFENGTFRSTATAEAAATRILDLVASLNFHEAFKLRFGHMYSPFDREFHNTANSRQMALDYSFITQKTLPGLTTAFPKTEYDVGPIIWGNLVGPIHIQYRLAALQGRTEPNPQSKFRYAGRLEVNFLDPVKEWYRMGTYLGKRKVLSIGAGFDHQDDAVGGTTAGAVAKSYSAGVVDVFFDHPVGGGAVTLDGAYLSMNYNGATGGCGNGFCATTINATIQNSDGTGWYVMGGYLLPDTWGVGPMQGQLQPVVRYQYWDSAWAKRQGGVAVGDRRDFDVGLNYFLVGHDAKLVLNYLITRDYSTIPEHETRLTLAVVLRL